MYKMIECFFVKSCSYDDCLQHGNIRQQCGACNGFASCFYDFALSEGGSVPE